MPSPCYDDDDGFHPVCSTVIGVGAVVAVVSVCCVYHIVKLCIKLKRDKVTFVR